MTLKNTRGPHHHHSLLLTPCSRETLRFAYACTKMFFVRPYAWNLTPAYAKSPQQAQLYIS